MNEALAALERDFSALYPPIGRPSVPPEKLLRAMLLQAFYSIRSERQLMERLEYDLLFRWFVGIGVDEAAWDHSSFSTNRDRLLEGDIAAKFLAAVLLAAAGEAAVVERSLLGRRHADRGVGVDEELQAAERVCGRRDEDGGAATPPAEAAGATPRRTSTARSGRTRPMPRPPIPTPGSTGRDRARRRSSASSAMA